MATLGGHLQDFLETAQRGWDTIRDRLTPQKPQSSNEEDEIAARSARPSDRAESALAEELEPGPSQALEPTSSYGQESTPRSTPESVHGSDSGSFRRSIDQIGLASVNIPPTPGSGGSHGARGGLRRLSDSLRSRPGAWLNGVSQSPYRVSTPLVQQHPLFSEEVAGQRAYKVLLKRRSQESAALDQAKRKIARREPQVNDSTPKSEPRSKSNAQGWLAAPSQRTPQSAPPLRGGQWSRSDYRARSDQRLWRELRLRRSQKSPTPAFYKADLVGKLDPEGHEKPRTPATETRRPREPPRSIMYPQVKDPRLQRRGLGRKSGDGTPNSTPPDAALSARANRRAVSIGSETFGARSSAVDGTRSKEGYVSRLGSIRRPEIADTRAVKKPRHSTRLDGMTELSCRDIVNGILSSTEKGSMDTAGTKRRSPSDAPEGTLARVGPFSSTTPQSETKTPSTRDAIDLTRDDAGGLVPGGKAVGARHPSAQNGRAKAVWARDRVPSATIPGASHVRFVEPKLEDAFGVMSPEERAAAQRRKEEWKKYVSPVEKLAEKIRLSKAKLEEQAGDYEERQRRRESQMRTAEDALLKIRQSSSLYDANVDWSIEQEKHIDQVREELKEKAKACKAGEDAPRSDVDYVFPYWNQPDTEWSEANTETQDELQRGVSVEDESSAFSSLTKSALNRVRRHMNLTSNEQLVEINGIPIHSRDLQLLKPSRWLNDEIINGYMELIMARSRHHAGSTKNDRRRFLKVHAMTSFFYARLYGKTNGVECYDYTRVRRWTRRVDVFAYDLVLIPINLANSHWALATVDLREKKIEYFDSLGYGNTDVLSHILQWICDESKDKKKTELDTSSWQMIAHGTSVPQQTNSDDCGVFLCKYADFLSRGAALNFSASHMNYFRARIASELLVKRLA